MEYLVRSYATGKDCRSEGSNAENRWLEQCPSRDSLFWWRDSCGFDLAHAADKIKARLGGTGVDCARAATSRRAYKCKGKAQGHFPRALRPYGWVLPSAWFFNAVSYIVDGGVAGYVDVGHSEHGLQLNVLGVPYGSARYPVEQFVYDVCVHDENW